MTTDPRPLLVTSALPYANGPLHFGHIAGAYLPADIWVRWQRLRGSDVVFVCGTDEHGVAITVKAEAAGQTYADYVAHWHAEIARVFRLWDLSFDHFARTSRRDPHYPLAQEAFLRLLRAGNVAPRGTQQHFCLTCQRFLPDRYVEGTCYLCGAAARGDECKGCGAWLEAVRLLAPRCVTCRSTPELRPTSQFELDLSPISSTDRQVLERAFGADFADWLPAFRARLKPNVRAMAFDKLIEGEGLRARPITRDLPWGVPVPATDLDGRPVPGADGKVLYVWFDAPIGYVSATAGWARDVARDGTAWRRYWIARADAPAEQGPRLIHFLGKDNIPFHCIVFPAMQAGQAAARPGERPLGPGPGERWVLPEDVPANEFYNLEGRKFSTSDGWMLDTDRTLDLFGQDALRWYLAVSMPETADSDFLFDELQARVNAELADTLGNYATRVLKFTHKNLGNRVPDADPGHAWAGDLPVARAACAKAFREVGGQLQAFSFRRAAQAVVELGRFGNKLFDERAPWKARKDDPPGCDLAIHCNLQVLASLSVLLTPFVPAGAARLRAMLALPALDSGPGGRQPGADRWQPGELPAGHGLGEPAALFAKLADETIAAEKAQLRTG